MNTKIVLLIAIIFSFINANAQLNSAEIVESIEKFQQEENEHYQDSVKSPLRYNMENVSEFKGHPFFDIDLDFYVTADFEKLKRKKKFKMKTSTNRMPKYYTYGIAKFNINGKEYQLSLYRNADAEKENDYLFLPFTDLTNNEETYGGGRYINMKIPKNKKLVIDFNKAYNPYCAYSYKFSCPIVPKENFLDLEVKAGVKYEDVWH